MRVAIVCPYDLGRPGGVQDQTIRLVGWLQDAGHDAALIGPGVEGPDGAFLLGSTTVLSANRSTVPIKLDPRVVSSLRSALDGFDVVHVHEPLVPLISPVALRAGGSATVATFHADPPGWVRRAYHLGQAAVRRTLQRAAVVTAVSPVAASGIEGIVDYRLIPNGIDVADYSTGPKTPNRLTFLGRDDTRKGLDVMLEAWPLILGAVPDATLHVIGAERVAMLAGLSYLGRVTEEDKRSELAESVIHAAPNLGGESFGVVVLEAMASGCAVAASAIPAFGHLAGNAATLITPGDPEELASAVIELLQDPDRARSMGEAARLRALDFDGPRIAAQYIQAYEDALTSHER